MATSTLLTCTRVLTIVLCTLVVAHSGLATNPNPTPPEQRTIPLFQNLRDAGIPTGILYDQVLPLSNIGLHNGQHPLQQNTLSTWRQMYHEIYHATLDPKKLTNPQQIRRQARLLTKTNIHPIGVMHFQYNTIKPTALEQGLLTLSNGEFIDSSGPYTSPYDTRVVFASAALKDYTYQGKTVNFLISSDFYYTNLQDTPVALGVDFDDGVGFRTAKLSESFVVHYSTTGPKIIRFRAHYPKYTLDSSFTFTVRASSLPEPEETWNLESSDTHTTTGEAYIYKSRPNTPIDRPIIVVEGFDPDNSLGRDDLYSNLNQESFLEDQRANGFDFIVLNFGDGGTYIQANAFLLVDLIEEVNARKKGGVANVVIGASMGGLVARYALAYMEANGIPHDTSLFVSFDAPQSEYAGANIPLSLQYWLSFFAEFNSTAEEKLALLKTPAAEQLLAYYYATGRFTTPPIILAEQEAPSRTSLFAELARLGNYPMSLRKLAIANGSGHALDQGFSRQLHKKSA